MEAISKAPGSYQIPKISRDVQRFVIKYVSTNLSFLLENPIENMHQKKKVIRILMNYR